MFKIQSFFYHIILWFLYFILCALQYCLCVSEIECANGLLKNQKPKRESTRKIKAKKEKEKEGFI